MSNSNSNPEGNSTYLINPYAKPISRLVRTKDTNQESSILTKPTQSLITQPSLLVRKGRNEQTINQTQKLTPARVSDLSANVVFQDVDSPTKSISKKSAKQQQVNKDKQVKANTIGLIGNAFMGATTKYNKVNYEQITTPIKNILPQEINTPKNSETQINTHTKFSRRREVQPSKLEKQNELTLDFNIMKSQAKEENWTDRSANQNSRKIERKTDRNRRQIKFGEKRQTKEIENQTLSQLGQQSRILERNSKLNEISKQINNQTQSIETSVVKPKPYQPIKRSNADTIQVQTPNKITQSRPASNYRIDRSEQSTQLIKEEKSEPSLAQKQQAVKKQQVKSQTLLSSSVKKSALVGYAIKRLLFTQLSNSFSQLKLIYYQIKNKVTKQSWLLGQAVFSITQNKEIGFVRWSFEMLKYKFSQKYVTQLKNELIYKEPNRTLIALNLLEKIYQSKLQSVLRKLRNKHFLFKQQIKSLSILDFINKKKIIQLKQASLLALGARSKYKIYHLTNLNKIVANFNKYKTNLAFLKLQAAAKPKIEKSSPQKKTNIINREPITPKQQQQSNTPIKTNPALVQKAQKMRSIINSVKDNLTIINKKLKEAEQKSSQQKQELDYKVVNLKQNNQEIESQLQSKKGRIQLIQNQLNNINSKVEPKDIQDELEINTQDHNLQKIVRIYMGNYKHKEELITPNEIIEEFQLNYDNSSKACLQWQLLADNIQLKQLIAAYEQYVSQVEFKARKMALAQQQVAGKLVRSYIKEQYFWQWLHLTAQSLQSK